MQVPGLGVVVAQPQGGGKEEGMAQVQAPRGRRTALSSQLLSEDSRLWMALTEK